MRGVQKRRVRRVRVRRVPEARQERLRQKASRMSAPRGPPPRARALLDRTSPRPWRHPECRQLSGSVFRGVPGNPIPGRPPVADMVVRVDGVLEEAVIQLCRGQDMDVSGHPGGKLSPDW